MSSERDKLCGNPDVFMGQDGEVEAGGGGGHLPPGTWVF